jgi:hypothetical protein
MAMALTMTRLAPVTTALLIASASAFAPHPLNIPSSSQKVNQISYHRLDYTKSFLQSSTIPDDKSTDLIGDDSAYFSFEEQVRTRGKCSTVSLNQLCLTFILLCCRIWVIGSSFQLRLELCLRRAPIYGFYQWVLTGETCFWKPLKASSEQQILLLLFFPCWPFSLFVIPVWREYGRMRKWLLAREHGVLCLR